MNKKQCLKGKEVLIENMPVKLSQRKSSNIQIRASAVNFLFCAVVAKQALEEWARE